MQVSSVRPLWRNGLKRAAALGNLGISARSAAVSGIVVLVAYAFASAALDAVLYRSLLVGVDDATTGRVRNIAAALQSGAAAELNRDLLTTNRHVVAIQVIAPDGKMVERSGSAPETPLVPVTDFDLKLRRGMPDDAVPDDDMRVSGQRVRTPSGEYTVIVGGQRGGRNHRTNCRAAVGVRRPHHRRGGSGCKLLARSQIHAIGRRDPQSGGRDLHV